MSRKILVRLGLQVVSAELLTRGKLAVYVRHPQTGQVIGLKPYWEKDLAK